MPGESGKASPRDCTSRSHSAKQLTWARTMGPFGGARSGEKSSSNSISTAETGRWQTMHSSPAPGPANVRDGSVRGSSPVRIRARSVAGGPVSLSDVRASITARKTVGARRKRGRGRPRARGRSDATGWETAPNDDERRDRRRRKRRVRGTTGRPGTDGRSTALAGRAFPRVVPAGGARDGRKENGRPSGEGSEPEHVRQDPKDGDLRLRWSKVGGNSDGSSRLVLTCKSFFRRRA